MFSQTLLGQESSSGDREKAKALLLLERCKRERAPAPMPYPKARALSIAEHKPLLVVVGAQRPDLDTATDFIVCHVNGPWEDVESGIVVARDDYWIQTLPAGASLRQVQAVVARFRLPGRVGSAALALAWSC